MDKEKVKNYTHFLEMPLKIVGCWDWYPKPQNEKQILINNVYFCMVFFVLLNLPVTLAVNLYTEWVDIMSSLDKIAEGFPLLVSVAIVSYFGIYKSELYELIDFMNDNFKFYSARGLTNMNMWDSYKSAKNFAFTYTACTLFSVSMYVLVPLVFYVWTNQPMDNYIYMDVINSPFFEIVFMRQCVAQALLALAIGQFGVFFAANSILLCGQLDLLCCSLRNVRYTGILLKGVNHSALLTKHSDIVDDEKHNYIYNKARLEDSHFHYDKDMTHNFSERTHFDIYSYAYDSETSGALNECAHICQVINKYKVMFERFVSPLLVLRVVQVTLYLCTLLYTASLKFELITVEYLVAVALDIFVYCYFGNQIILQASRVSTAAYQSAWHCMGVRPRRVLLNLLLANRRAINVRAGGFLSMDLHTFLVIIKTSFSYYTLLVNVNDHQN